MTIRWRCGPLRTIHASARPSCSAISAVIGWTLATPRTPSVPKRRRGAEAGGGDFVRGAGIVSPGSSCLRVRSGSLLSLRGKVAAADRRRHLRRLTGLAHVMHADDLDAGEDAGGDGGERPRQPLAHGRARHRADEALARGADEERLPQGAERVEPPEEREVLPGGLR